MPEVKCTVNNCEYWGEQNQCVADQILISAGPTFGKPKHGENAEALSPTPAQVNEDTYCWTFEPRGVLEAEELEYEEEIQVRTPLI